MARAGFLRQRDRDLVEAVLVEGQPVKAVARMNGMTPRALRCHIYHLARLMVSRDFVQTVRAVAYLERQEAYIATRCYCHEVSQRDLAAELGLSVHALRRRLDQISSRIDTIMRRWWGDSPAWAEGEVAQEAAGITPGE